MSSTISQINDILNKSNLTSADWSKIYFLLESQSDEQDTREAVDLLFDYYIRNTPAVIAQPFALNMLLDIFYRNPQVFESNDKTALFIKNTSPILFLANVNSTSDLGVAIDLFEQFLDAQKERLIH